MGVSSHVVGFRPPDAEYKKKAAAWEACRAAGVEPPDELVEYFDERAPDPSGLEVDIGCAVTSYRAEMVDGFEVNISNLPKGVKTIRFFNSY